MSWGNIDDEALGKMLDISGKKQEGETISPVILIEFNVDQNINKGA